MQQAEKSVSAKHGAKWPRKREQAIAALLTYPTIKQAAKAVGVHEITLIKWMKQQEFDALYQRAKASVLEMASEALRSGCVQAVAVLREIAGNRRLPSSSRVMACRTFLEGTNLLKGMSALVTVNNSIPQDAEGLTAEIVKQLGGMLKTDAALREAVKAMLVELEEKDEPTVN